MEEGREEGRRRREEGTDGGTAAGEVRGEGNSKKEIDWPEYTRETSLSGSVSLSSLALGASPPSSRHPLPGPCRPEYSDPPEAEPNKVMLFATEYSESPCPRVRDRQFLRWRILESLCLHCQVFSFSMLHSSFINGSPAHPGPNSHRRNLQIYDCSSVTGPKQQFCQTAC